MRKILEKKEKRKNKKNFFLKQDKQQFFFTFVTLKTPGEQPKAQTWLLYQLVLDKATVV